MPWIGCDHPQWRASSTRVLPGNSVQCCGVIWERPRGTGRCPRPSLLPMPVIPILAWWRHPPMRAWRGARERIRRVVMLGPAHRMAVQGLALPRATAFATPLGRVAVDLDAVRLSAGLPQVHCLDAVHALEHCLEVQLPFLQEKLVDFEVVPLLVGRAAPREVRRVLELLWGGHETLVVISSDLSHYHDYEAARKLDRDTSQVIEDLRDRDLRSDQACGCIPIQGLLQVARQRRLRAENVDLRNSGDTAGPRDRVVGYGAYVFT